MTPEREAVARIICIGHLFTSPEPACAECLRDADRIIAEHVAPLRSSLATAERERDEARAEQRRQVENMQVEIAVTEAERDKAGINAVRAFAGERRRAAASQRMTASVERSLDRSIALHEAAEALLTEAGRALAEMASATNAFPNYAGHARVTVSMGGCRRARDLLTRIEAREGGAKSLIAGEEKGNV